MPKDRSEEMKQRRVEHRAAAIKALGTDGVTWQCAWCEDGTVEDTPLAFWPPTHQTVKQLMKRTPVTDAAQAIAVLLRGHGGRCMLLCPEHVKMVQDAMSRYNCGPFWTPGLDPYIRGDYDVSDESVSTQLAHGGMALIHKGRSE